MSDGALGLTQLFLFLFFIMLGFPIAFTLMAMGLFFGYLGMEDRIFDLLIQRTYSVMANDVLISVPLFVFMGYIIERANILDRLFRSLQMASGNIPGSLAVATLATSALFATAPGTAGAGGPRAPSQAASRWRRWPPARCSPPPPASSAPW